MTPREELIRLLAEVNVTNAYAAQMLGIAESTLYRWLSGESKVPKSALMALRLTGAMK